VSTVHRISSLELDVVGLGYVVLCRPSRVAFTHSLLWTAVCSLSTNDCKPTAHMYNLSIDWIIDNRSVSKTQSILLWLCVITNVIQRRILYIAVMLYTAAAHAIGARSKCCRRLELERTEGRKVGARREAPERPSDVIWGGAS